MKGEEPSTDLLEQLDELDRLETRRSELGASFLRRNLGLGIFSAAGVASLLPVALDYTPLEYGLPCFVIAIMSWLGVANVRTLVRGVSERRELDREIAIARTSTSAGRVGPQSQGLETT